MLTSLLSQQHILLERFLNYLSHDTQAKIGAKTKPSSKGQLKFAQQLAQELKALGLEQIELSPTGVLTAYLPSNQTDNPEAIPCIGLLAHLDSSPQCNGKNIRPEVIENYRGGDIALGIGDEFLSPVYFPFMKRLVGHSLIVTDGNSLLGADSKAGIAEIITAISILQQSQRPHCHLRLAFIPDQSLGFGMADFPIDKFRCDWAYSLEGGEVGELAYENFNASHAYLCFQAKPTYASDNPPNASALACTFQYSLPASKKGEREGFYRLQHFLGDMQKAELCYLICDFEAEHLAQRKAHLQDLVNQFNQQNMAISLELRIEDAYPNMLAQIQKVPQSVQLAKNAMRELEIEPPIRPIRGGANGAWLSAYGIACPSIFTGGYNFHSKHEVICLEDMLVPVAWILTMAELALEG